MDPGAVYDCLKPRQAADPKLFPVTLPEQIRRLRDQRKASARRPKAVDSSDSDHVVDRRAPKKKRKRRRRRRNAQKPKRMTTPGIVDARVNKATAEAKVRDPEPAPKRSRIIDEADAARVTGFEQGVPTVRPISDVVTQFAMNARKSAHARREEVAEGIGEAVDADLAAEAEGGGSGLGDAAPDEYNALFAACALTTGPVDRSDVVWRLLEAEAARDRAYRNAAVELMRVRSGAVELRPPELGTGCTKDYNESYLREAGLALERPCAQGRFECICMCRAQTHPDTLETAKPESGFVGREFWRPDEWAQIKASGELPKARRTCRLCRLFRIKRANMSLKSTGLSVPAEGRYVIQDHWDVVGEPGTGGYTTHDMLQVTDEKTGRYAGLVATVQDFRASRFEFRIHEVFDPDTGEVRKFKGLAEKDQDF